MTEASSTIELVLQSDYRFEVAFGIPGVPRLVTDSTAPLGQGAGPDSEQLLVAAVANCLSASLLFSLRKFKNEAVPMQTTASARLVRNEQARLRMGSIQVEIRPGVPAGELKPPRPGDRAVRGLLRRDTKRARGDSRRSPDP